MRVMFICSGNSNAFGMAPFIRSQAESLGSVGVSVSYFLLKGKGVWGYMKNLPSLAVTYRREPCDIVHAHYGYSALVALMALPFRPVIVSFMGSDAYGEFDQEGRPRRGNALTRVIAKTVEHFADHLIVKSPNIQACFSATEKISVIPNGVDLDKFKPMEKVEARRLLGLKKERRTILFLGNVACGRKNFRLCEEAVAQLGEDVDLVAPYPVDPDKVAVYLSAADALVVTSQREGSPNVIKEAMACGCPVVTTDVGDVRWLLEGVSGSKVVGFEVEEVAAAIGESLGFSGRTNGRQRLVELGLDSGSIALKLERIYATLLKERKGRVHCEARI